MSDEKKEGLDYLEALSELNDVLDILPAYNISQIGKHTALRVEELEYDDLCALDKEISRFLAHTFLMSNFSNDEIKGKFTNRLRLVKQEMELRGSAYD